MTELQPAPRRTRVRARAQIGTVFAILAVAVVGTALLLSRPSVFPATPDASSAAPSDTPVPTSAATAGSESSPAAAFALPRRDDPGSFTGRPAATVVVVDASEGAAGAALDAERRALATFIEEYGSSDLGIVVHGGPARILVPIGKVLATSRQASLDAVVRIEAGGAPDLSGALALARDELTRVVEGTNRVLVVLGATPDPAITDLHAAVSGIAYDTVTVAVGRGADEAQLAQAAGGLADYQLASTPADLVERLADVRLGIDGAVLLAVGSGAFAGTGEVNVDPGTPQVRFTVYDPGHGRAVVVVDPGGRRLDVSSHDEGVAVRDGDDRVTIAVDRPQAGTWTLDAPANGRRHVEAFGSPAFDPAIRASALGDEGDEVQVGLMGSGLSGQPAAGTAVLEGPDSKARTVELELFPEGSDEFGLSGATTWAARLPTLSPAGSWVVRLRVTGSRDGAPFGYEFVHALYVPPRVDTDGDSIRDVIERGYGLDPTDPADGAEDPDMDGLSNARELAVLGTNPFRFDTDEGGESDGSEVGSGRNPLDRADDVRPASCMQRAVGPNGSPLPTPSPRPSPAVIPRDLALEATLPDTIAGQPTTKGSIVGPPEWHGFLGGLWSPLVICSGRTGDDLTVAYAVAQRLGNWSVVAVRVRGATGQRLAAIMAHEVMPGNEDSLGLHEETIEGRRVLASSVGWGLYARSDVLYIVISLNFGDFPEPPPVKPPPFEELLRDVVPALPAP